MQAAGGGGFGGGMAQQQPQQQQSGMQQVLVPYTGGQSGKTACFFSFFLSFFSYPINLSSALFLQPSPLLLLTK